MNLLEMLFSSMNNQNSVNSMSQKTGLSASQVSKLLILALPILLRALTKNAASRDGAKSLSDALGQHTSTDNMALQLQNADEEDGTKILGHILGGNLGNVVGALSQQTGVQQNQVQSLLGLIAPALLSGLSAATNHAQQQNSYDMSGLLSMFGGQPQQQQGGLLSQLFGAPQQQQQTGGLLSQLLGGGQVQQQQSGGFLSQLFGAKPQQQVQQIDGTALLQALLSLMK
ncbi:MAG: DUF937 domain-containing protein [Firmicutes bacterium]|nr:DUF937 domain-containing protein [Bacillota bacterium]